MLFEVRANNSLTSEVPHVFVSQLLHLSENKQNMYLMEMLRSKLINCIMKGVL